MSDRPEATPLGSEEFRHTSQEESHALERTLLVIKPDGVRRKLVGRIIATIETAGFEICALKLMRLSRKHAQELYKPHRRKSFYLPLIKFITSGPVVAVILQRDDAVRGLREIVGATDPAQAEEGTLRREFGTDVQKNAVHAAETNKDAEREIPLLFREVP